MVRNKRKRIVILTNNSFPIGLAGTNRIRSYCKGFMQNEFEPYVICIRPTEPFNEVFNKETVGIFQGIHYYYPGKTTIRSSSFWIRRYNDLKSYVRSTWMIFRFLRMNQVYCIIFYGNYITAELSFIFIAKIFRTPIFKEESENPNIYSFGSLPITNKVLKWYYLKKMYSNYDGILVMTHPLMNYFRSRGIPENRILLVPQTVDIARFENAVIIPSPFYNLDYIAYVGSLKQSKDGILTLVEAFLIIKYRYPLLHLLLAGEGTLSEEIELNSLIKKLGLKENVQLIGRISSEEIPDFLRGAKLLVSCRPKSLQADYGFPTKIVEYLATGKPTVTTATGELANYLEDGVNVFISSSADPTVFASKMLEVLENYDTSLIIAKKGKELVEEKFNPKMPTKMIVDFIKLKFYAKDKSDK